ncbi:hypothetical protein C0992_006277, partial [Termitomyces sp. T32_za158]
MASQITECLAATLSPDPNTRVSAELRLSELFASPGSSFEVPYTAFSSRPTETGLALSQLILAQDAITLTTIAKSDWPDEYPELLSSLITLLSSGSPDFVHGAMQVFTDFIKGDLTEDQILPVLRQLLPVLLTILGSKDIYSALTRARTISVFRQCVTALFMVKDQHPQATKEAASTILPVWLEAFQVLLNIDPKSEVTDTSNWDGLAIRVQVFKTPAINQTLDKILIAFPRAMKPYLEAFLTASVVHLQALHATFTEYYLSSSEATPGSSEEEAIELPQLICPILDFVSAVTREGKQRDWFNMNNIGSLVAAVFDFVQMTNEDEETWANNANAFVQQEDDTTQPYSVRVAGFDLLSSLMDRTQAETTRVFQLIVGQVIQSSHHQREAGRLDWWRPLEAALAAVGSQAVSILECLEDEESFGRQKPIDIEYLLSDIIPSILNLSHYPFLQGRGFVFASQYSKLLPITLAGQYLDAALQVIEAAEAGIPVKISAVKAVHNFFQGDAKPSVSALAPRVTKSLGPFLFITSEDTLSLVLETLSVILEVEQAKWLTAEMAESLVVALLEVWNKNNKDPIFHSILADIFTNLAASSSSGIYETIVKQALPPLTSAIASAKADESWIAESAIEFITSFVQGSPEIGLGEGFFALVAPSLFKCLGETEDRVVLQNGITCLTATILKDPHQLLSWNDGNCQSGLDYTLKLIAKTLENQEEFGGLVIGDLIIHLLRKAGESVLPILPQLLQAMVGRMTSAKTATFLQSLVIPFAFLINNQRDTVLSLLEGMFVNGRSGLDILVQTWCENASTFHGFWQTRISTLGLIQLFVSENPKLRQLIVKGDIIVNNTNRNVIMTRSRTKKTPIEFTSIPFPVKALKLVLRDVQSSGDSATISARGGAATNDIDSDDGVSCSKSQFLYRDALTQSPGFSSPVSSSNYQIFNEKQDEDWDEEEKLDPASLGDEFAFLSDMIGPRGVAFDNDDLIQESDDDAFKDDPVAKMDMQERRNLDPSSSQRSRPDEAWIIYNIAAEPPLTLPTPPDYFLTQRYMVLVTFSYRAQQKLTPLITDVIRRAFTSNESVLSNVLAGLKPVSFRVSIPPDGSPPERHPYWPVDVLTKDHDDIDKPVACLHLYQHNLTFSARMQPRIEAVA